jgi:hypothetical protein
VTVHWRDRSGAVREQALAVTPGRYAVLLGER